MAVERGRGLLAGCVLRSMTQGGVGALAIRGGCEGDIVGVRDEGVRRSGGGSGARRWYLYVAVVVVDGSVGGFVERERVERERQVLVSLASWGGRELLTRWLKPGMEFGARWLPRGGCRP